MLQFFFLLLLILVIISTIIYRRKILPVLKENGHDTNLSFYHMRGIGNDWIFGEYEKICINNHSSLIWLNIIKWSGRITLLIFVIFLISFISVTLMKEGNKVECSVSSSSISIASKINI